jgi:hypothetical protein
LKTEISIGSLWRGDPSDTIKQLIAMLEKETLEPHFYEFGNFFYTEDGKRFHAFGNFRTRSYQFQVSGPLKRLLPLARAIKQARRRPEYLRAWAADYRKPGQPRPERLIKSTLAKYRHRL